MRQAVILAGGRATRLGAISQRTPKYLLPVSGKPFAQRQIAQLEEAGYHELLICIGHLGEQIREALRDVPGIRFVADGPHPLGTGGALRAALPHLRETFLLTYGDSYLPFDHAQPLAELEAHPDALGVMAVYRNEGRFAPSNARVSGSKVVQYRKEVSDHFDCIDYGAIALRREAVRRLPAGESDLAALLEELAESGALRAQVVQQRFYEIGSPEGLAELERYLAGGAAAER